MREGETCITCGAREETRNDTLKTPRTATVSDQSAFRYILVPDFGESADDTPCAATEGRVAEAASL